MIDTDDKLPGYIALKNVVILITCIIKDDNKFYPQIFLEKTLYNEDLIQFKIFLVWFFGAFYSKIYIRKYLKQFSTENST